MPPVVQCYKCGTQNQLGMRFCISCGEKFAYNCPQCNNLIEPGSNNCSQCGVKLDWGNEPIQPAPPPPDNIPMSSTIHDPGNMNSKRTKTEYQQKGINPWFIAFIVVIILIVAIVVIDSIV